MVKRIIMIMLLLTFSWTIFPDDTATYYNLDSGTVIPINNNAVRMVEESVTFIENKVKTVFTFINDSKINQNITIGFPVQGDVDKQGMMDYEKLPKLNGAKLIEKINAYYNFKTSVDNKNIERKLVKVDAKAGEYTYDYMYIFDVMFKPGQTILIENEYSVKTAVLLSSMMVRSFAFKYILKTGKAWKDKIGKAHVSIFIPVEEYSTDKIENPLDYYIMDRQLSGWLRKSAIHASPAGFKTSIQYPYIVINWDFENLEPDFDIECRWETLDSERAFELSPWQINEIVKTFIINKQTNIQMTDKFNEDINASISFDDYLNLLYEYISGEYHAIENRNDETAELVEILFNLSNFYIASVYAAHGNAFTNAPNWQNLFKNLSWYSEKIDPLAFTKDEQFKIEQMSFILDRLKNKYGRAFTLP